MIAKIRNPIDAEFRNNHMDKMKASSLHPLSQLEDFAKTFESLSQEEDPDIVILGTANPVANSAQSSAIKLDSQ